MPTATDSPPTPGNNSVALQAVQKLVEQIENTLKITVSIFFYQNIQIIPIFNSDLFSDRLWTDLKLRTSTKPL